MDIDSLVRSRGGTTFDHVAIQTSFGARAGIHILETLKLEFNLSLDGCILHADGVVSMNLSVSHPDANRALGSLSL